MASDFDILDEAWAFVEKHLSKGVKKKDIVSLLNNAGYRTLKGKPWQYQTLLLEQRRRGSSRVQVGKDRVPSAAMKLAVVAPVKKSKTNVGSLNLEDQHLSNILKNDQFDEAIRIALEENYTLTEISRALNAQGSMDPKGRPWNEAMLNHVWTQRITKLADAKDPLGKWGISELMDRGNTDMEKVYGGELQPKKISPNVDEAWERVQLEMKKGVKKKAIVGILNMGGYLTRRGKPWTYQTLMQEFLRHKGEIKEKSLVSEKKLSEKEIGEIALSSPLEHVRAVLCREVLPKINELGLLTPQGNPWTYEILLWELFKQDCDLETLLSPKSKKWWAKKKESRDLGVPTLFDIL